jgi:tol-pal system protein YbgF
VFGYLPANPGQGQASGAGRPQLLQPGQATPAQAQTGTQTQTQTGSQTGAPATGQQAAVPAGTPEDQYNQAFALLRAGDYASAEQALKGFLAAHPQHELAGNAQYWLGETYYVRGDYKQAAVAFLDGYRAYPKSAKGPDNLLKLGITMGQIGQSKEACAAFQKLSADYPQASDVIKRRAASERDKLGCR